MTNPLNPSSLLTPLISSAAMRAIVDDRTKLQRMLDFEAALARAEAAVAVIPAGAVDRIGAACKAELYDLAKLGEAAARSGNVAAAVIAALGEEVAKTDVEAARFVNWGAAAQDLADSALMLELRAGLDALITDLNTAIDGFTLIAGRHRRTAAVARTLLQHALPMPFGLKLAGYAAALARSRERLRRLRKEGLALQFGGVAGTLASLGENGLAVTDRLAALLDLPAPDAPWHAHSDRVAEIASALAILTGTCGKIARDVALMMQTEVGEAHEPPRSHVGEAVGLPHRRAPNIAATGVAAATIAPNLLATIVAGQVQEHERGLGGWQAQWHAMPALLLVTSGALAAVNEIAQGLETDAERMRANLDVGQGLIMVEAVTIALGAKLGPHQAKLIVEEASRQAISSKRHLNSILAEDTRVTAHMTPGELARLFELMGYQGVAQTYIDRLIGSLGSRAPKR
ncbi:MAG: 3-carboxy-cis,cis-muconate cycloisomerase [Xanthobacteraceae bacterium]|nr:3-carboxy-cis,cis-muconate cycloisomerase [Xanthobacteraceae bacterium]